MSASTLDTIVGVVLAAILGGVGFSVVQLLQLRERMARLEERTADLRDAVRELQADAARP